MTTGYASTLRSDFELADSIELVTLTNPVTATVTSNVKSRQRTVTFAEIITGTELGIAKTDNHFMLGCLSLAGIVPLRGDKITDSLGVEWTLISAKVFSFSSTPIYYDCLARPQR